MKINDHISLKLRGWTTLRPLISASNLSRQTAASPDTSRYRMGGEVSKPSFPGDFPGNSVCFCCSYYQSSSLSILVAPPPWNWSGWKLCVATHNKHLQCAKSSSIAAGVSTRYLLDICIRTYDVWSLKLSVKRLHLSLNDQMLTRWKQMSQSRNCLN